MNELYFDFESGLRKEVHFKYKGHNCIVVSDGRFPRAYIERSYENEPLNVIECHCGVTFENETKVGWDYAHAGDYLNLQPFEQGHMWTLEEVIEEIKEALDGFLNRLSDAMGPLLTDGTITEAEFEEIPF